MGGILGKLFCCKSSRSVKCNKAPFVGCVPFKIVPLHFQISVYIPKHNVYACVVDVWLMVNVRSVDTCTEHKGESISPIQEA